MKGFLVTELRNHLPYRGGWIYVPRRRLMFTANRSADDYHYIIAIKFAEKQEFGQITLPLRHWVKLTHLVHQGGLALEPGLVDYAENLNLYERIEYEEGISELCDPLTDIDSEENLADLLSIFDARGPEQREEEDDYARLVMHIIQYA